MTQKVAEYELYKRIKLLGEGAFGKAYLVEFLQDNSVWVIKYMDMNTMSPQEKDETLREAKILELLRHPNIVKFKEVYKTKKGKLCIVMEYADGQDIAKRIKDAKGHFFSENQILDWFTQICLALKHVHDRKIIHRDLKGQNIFLTKDNRVKLGDFGIARVLKKTIEKAKTMVGTPYYISPEIVEGRPYSLMTDIWSIGVVLYEMCALKTPFNAESLHFLALKIVKGQYQPIPTHYSKDLRSLVGLLLQVDPRRRPTISEILKLPVIVNRIKAFLSESTRHSEFSHTALHRQVFEPVTNMNHVNIINKELPCPPDLLQQNSRDLGYNNLPKLKPEVKPEIKQEVKQEVKQPQKQNLVAIKSQPSQFDPKPQVAQNKQFQSQPNQFIEPVQPNLLRPPVLQQPLRPPVIDLPKEIKKIESKEQLLKNNNKPSVPAPQQQRPQSNHVVPTQIKSPQAQPKILPKVPLSNAKPQSSRPQSSNQQQKQQDSKEQVQVVQKEVVIKQRPSSEYRLNDAPKKNPERDRIDERIKNLKVNEQKQKDQLQIELLRKQSLKEQQKKEETRREEQRQEDLKSKRNEQVRQREEEQSKMKDDIKRKLDQQQKEALQKEAVQKEEVQKEISQKEPVQKEVLKKEPVVVANQNQQQLKQAIENGKKQAKMGNLQLVKGKSNESVGQSNQSINDKISENNKQFDQMLIELEAVIHNVNSVVSKLPEQAQNNYFDLQTQIIQPINQEDRDDDSDEPDDIDPEVELQIKMKQEQKKKIDKLSEEEVECLSAINNNNNKDSFSTLRITLEKLLGQKNFDKAVKILKDLIDNNSLDVIEQKYGKSYEDLLPFLTDNERKKFIPLLITHVITNSGCVYE